MKTKAIVVIAGLTAAVLALPASAQISRGGFYLGAGVGQSDFKVNCSASPCDTKGRGFKLFAGYQFHPNVGVEVGYADLGKGTVGASNIKGNVWELDAVGSYPIARGFSVIGRAGFYNGDLTVTTPSTGADQKATNTSWTWGIGGQADVTRNFAARIEWQAYNSMGGGSLGKKTDVNMLSISGVWRFE